VQEFVTTLVSFPTIVFTFALAAALLYWVVVIFGALDIDFLDTLLGLDSMDAAFDGAVESLDGAVDGALDGAAEGVADADGVDGEGGGLLSSLLNAMGVRGVPITIVGTFAIFWAWIISYLATRFFGPLAATLLAGITIAIAAGLGALVMAAISSRPFRKLFDSHQAPRRASLVGKLCTVMSARVDETFGRAEIQDGGAGFVAEVRCPQENDLKRGAQALVYRYEPSEGIFFIGPVDAALAEAVNVTDES
jgi:membrane protein implicated in regulation of membrane protease activity